MADTPVAVGVVAALPALKVEGASSGFGLNGHAPPLRPLIKA